MEINKNITIELSENDVKEIIVNYLLKEGYNATVDDVHVSVGSRLDGYGKLEYPVSYLKSVHINCKEHRG